MHQGHPQQKPRSNKLRIARIHAGYPQKWVAEALGQKSVSSVSEYEQGHTDPALRAALTLSAFYGIPVEELFQNIYAEVSRNVAQFRQGHLAIRRRDADVRRVRDQNSGLGKEVPSSVPVHARCQHIHAD